MPKVCNKVVLGNEVLLDLTADTIQASKLQSGATAHDKSGATIIGTAAITYNSSTKELTMPDWAVTING